jgi:hypothetical protein
MPKKKAAKKRKPRLDASQLALSIVLRVTGSKSLKSGVDR